MSKSKLLAFGGMLTALAVLFQIIPVIFTEVFVFMTMLSAIPIYLITRANVRFGVCAMVAAGILIMLISTHEGILFFCTNGPVGLVLGVCHYYGVKRTLTALIGGSVLAATLCLVNYIIGIPIFGTPLSGPLWGQLAMIVGVSLVYCTIYQYIAGRFYLYIVKVWIGQTIKRYLQ